MLKLNLSSVIKSLKPYYKPTFFPPKPDFDLAVFDGVLSGE